MQNIKSYLLLQVLVTLFLELLIAFAQIPLGNERIRQKKAIDFR